MFPIYRIDLTQEEFDHLFRQAEEGVQAAMKASLVIIPAPSNTPGSCPAGEHLSPAAAAPA